MKKYFFTLAAGLVTALVTINGANAQSLNQSDAMQNDLAVVSNGSLILKASTGKPDLSAISTKAIKEFTKNYKNVSGEEWDKTIDGFRAKFTLNNVGTSIYYDKYGRWSGSLKTYHEAQLDKQVRTIVKRQYFDFSIVLVQEIETPQSDGLPTHVVYIEDEDDYKIVLVNDGEMKIWNEFKKQK